MTEAATATPLGAELAARGLAATATRHGRLGPFGEIGVPAAHWAAAARAAADTGHRFAALWAEERGASLVASALLERGGAYTLLRTRVPARAPVLASIATAYVAADRPERHARDLYGIELTGAPDNRRWTRHRAWEEREFPLRREFPVQGRRSEPAPPDVDYPFVQATGAGVYEIPVGPVHAGVIEPGHFRFQAVGEDVLRLEERLGYVHKGVEKIAEGRDPAALARLAGRVSGDSTVAHAWAACMAMERAARFEAPARALALRAVLCERERVANHLWDIAAVCNDVAFAFACYQLGRLLEDWRRVNARAFGHRLLMDAVVPGGVAADVDAAAVAALRVQGTAVRAELESLWVMLQENDSLHDRLDATGELRPEDARALGCVGFVGRASGVDFDVRRDAPYAPYDALEVSAPAFDHGDVAARVRVRYEEIRASIALVERLLATLPAGPVAAPFTPPARGAAGLGIVDGWRGEVATYVRFGAAGRIARCFPRDPSWLTWPALERLIHGNIVPDFPVCNKSVNASYSGHDL